MHEHKRALSITLLSISFFSYVSLVTSFQRFTTHNRRVSIPFTRRGVSAVEEFSGSATDDTEIQWELFQKHHAKGSWKGIWQTYDYIGDVVDETIGSVNFDTVAQENDSPTAVQQSHTIVVGAKRSDCETCFDSMETRTFPVAAYTPDTLLRRSRCAANSMVNGPSVLKSGIMATELVLARGDGRVRVVLQHAPVWEAGVEPGSCPPQGLKLFRTIVSREALRPTPPTAENEAKNPPTSGNPIFNRPVPPFNWHKKWAGSSWTWGPAKGNRGWAIEEMEETDAWQGISTVEKWNLRLPGGIFIQAPRVITGSEAGLCRLAWLPDDETLLRVEAGIIALQPIPSETDEELMVGFYPPSLASLRCDVTQKIGELENASLLTRGEEEVALPSREEDINSGNHDDVEKDVEMAKTTDTKRDDGSEKETIENVLKL